jgi:hypothetical protein
LELLYSKADETRNYKRLIVTSSVADSVQRHHMVEKVEVFPSQEDRAFKAMRRATISDTLGSFTLGRPPTMDMLLERSNYLKDSSVKRTCSAREPLSAPNYRAGVSEFATEESELESGDEEVLSKSLKAPNY